MVSEADIERSHADPRFKQVLLARVLEQLLGALQRGRENANASGADTRDLREGALMAVRLADLIRAIDDRLRLQPLV